MATNNMRVPTPQQFERQNTGMFGTHGSYIDWAAYNQAVQQYNAAQEQARYNQGITLLSDVMKMFGDNGAYEQSYRNAKNRFMAKSASDMVSRGMANLVNAPAMGLAYDREVRPEFEMQRQNRLAGAMTNMAQYMMSYSPQYSPQPMAFSNTINRPQATSSQYFGPVSAESTGPSTLESPFSRFRFV